jgi:hypothetical protein
MLRLKAIVLPRGDHAGCVAPNDSDMRTGPEAFKSSRINQERSLQLLTKTRLWPLGDHDGWESPHAGRVVVNRLYSPVPTSMIQIPPPPALTAIRSSTGDHDGSDLLLPFTNVLSDPVATLTIRSRPKPPLDTPTSYANREPSGAHAIPVEYSGDAVSRTNPLPPTATMKTDCAWSPRKKAICPLGRY